MAHTYTGKHATWKHLTRDDKAIVPQAYRWMLDNGSFPEQATNQERAQLLTDDLVNACGWTQADAIAAGEYWFYLTPTP